MYLLKIAWFSLLAAAMFAAPLQARPVGYQGVKSLVFEGDGFRSRVGASYTFFRSFSLGAEYWRVETAQSEQSKLGFMRANWLIKRWFAPSSQANIYAYGGVGGGRFDQSEELAFLLGSQADFETRRILLMTRYDLLSSREQSFHQIMGRVGIAPYLADINELNTWLLVQVAHRSEAEDDVIITPMLRWFYKNVLWELGVSLDGNALFTVQIEI